MANEAFVIKIMEALSSTPKKGSVKLDDELIGKVAKEANEKSNDDGSCDHAYKHHKMGMTTSVIGLHQLVCTKCDHSYWMNREQFNEWEISR